jgi:hypothetical protein
MNVAVESARDEGGMRVYRCLVSECGQATRVVLGEETRGCLFVF